MAVRIPGSAVTRFKGGRLCRYVNLVVQHTANGRAVRVPLRGGIGFDNLDPSEPWFDGILPVLLRRKAGAFVDVGVNVGQTLIKVKTLEPDVPYIGFEPNPVCFEYTKQLIVENGFRHCTLLPVGLSNKAGVVSLFLRDEADVSASIVEGVRPPEHYSDVRHVAVFQGDAMLETIGAPDIAVVKVDVEGAESEVLDGLHATLQRRPFVICEILPLFSEDGPRGRFRKPRQDRLLATMRQAGYVLYRLMPDATAVPIDDIPVHRDMTLSNYLFAPSEDREYIGVTVAPRPTTAAR